MFRRINILLLLITSSCTPIIAEEIVYSNITYGYGWSAFLPVHTVWDDITPLKAGRLSSLGFIARIGTSSQPVDQIEGLIEFRRFDNPDGGPLGSLIGSVPFEETLTLDPLKAYLITIRNLGKLGISLPNERFAVGISMTNDSWSLIRHSPPTIGATTGSRWLLVDGTVYDDEDIGPGSYGWQLAVIPEPCSTILGLSGFSILFLMRWCR